MRTIFQERASEKPLAGGRYQYRRDGQPTGSEESWRVTLVPGGYSVLRADLNAEAGEGGDSTLYHLLLNQANRPERLEFRHFRRGRMIRGNVIFEDDRVILAQSAELARREVEVTLAGDYAFWYPATSGLGLAGRMVSSGEWPALRVVKGEAFGLQQAVLSVRRQPVEEIVIMGRTREARPVILHWTEAGVRTQRTLWLDEGGWPLKMVRDDGLSAVETRAIRYQSAS
jgi:hypothetical protein